LAGKSAEWDKMAMWDPNMEAVESEEDEPAEEPVEGIEVGGYESEESEEDPLDDHNNGRSEILYWGCRLTSLLVEHPSVKLHAPTTSMSPKLPRSFPLSIGITSQQQVEKGMEAKHTADLYKKGDYRHRRF
jgi:hypothetical protein